MICTLLRKPLLNINIAVNVTEWGSGGLNTNGTRVEGPAWTWGTQTDIRGGGYGAKRPTDGDVLARNVQSNPAGRYPANLILYHFDYCLPKSVDWQCVAGCPVRVLSLQSGIRPGMSGGGAADNTKNGNELITSFNRKPSAPFIRSDSGTASRFFKQVKP